MTRTRTRKVKGHKTGKNKARHAYYTLILKSIWISVLMIVVGLPVYIMCVKHDLFGLFGGMPSLRAIEDPQNDLSSEIVSADGVSLGRYFRFNRSQVSYDELSDELVKVVIISEDHRFYDHAGIDFWSYPRVLWGVLTSGNGGGGSTITQQLAKNLFRTRERELNGSLALAGESLRTIISKTKEWIISVELEKNFTKEEILAMYLNTSAFNNNAYGIRVASETYFNKQPKDLNLQESAMLAGMLQNPVLFNPKTNPKAALRKRNKVLSKLLTHGYIATPAVYDSIRLLPVALKFSVQNHNQGLAPHFRNVLFGEMLTWCRANGYDLRDSGLKFYTTIDSRMQAMAEQAVSRHMEKLQASFDKEWSVRNSDPWIDDETGKTDKHFVEKKIRRTGIYNMLVERYGKDSDSVNIMLNMKKPMTIFTWKGERDTLFSSVDSVRYYNRFLQTGLMAMDPHTGAVKAWVGGINHKYFKYDHVRQARRQPGSTFKPFVYGTAIAAGFSPCQELRDISPNIKLPKGYYRPRNSDGGYGNGDKLTLRKAMARSLNSVTAQVMEDVNPHNVVDFARQLGIESPLDPVYSLALGTSDVTLSEMVAAYCAFVNLGFQIKPFYLTHIEDKYGKIIADFRPHRKQALDEGTAYKMVYMLQGVIEEGNSANLSKDLRTDNEIGGKTGTTQDASDGWYIGITHNLVTGIWVGGIERSIRFPQWSFGQGSKTARPIWDDFMSAVYRHPETGYKKGFFQRPSSGLDITLDCDQYREHNGEIDDAEAWSAGN